MLHWGPGSNRGHSNRFLLGAIFLLAASTTVDAARAETVNGPQPGHAGGFFNYDLHYKNHGDNRIGSGLFEFGVFNRWGVATTTFTAQGLDTEERLTRQNSTWHYDWPQERRTLVLGDSLTRTGAWGRSVPFGGVQWSSDFDAQPDLIRSPLARSGAVAPMTSVERYVNAVHPAQELLHSDLFSERAIPDEIDVNPLQRLMQDVLDREPDISHRFNVGEHLLKGGLQDYTFEAGFVRENYAVESNDYGRVFVTGAHRLGLTDWLIGEARAEVLSSQQTFGINSVMVSMPWLDTVTGSVVGSNADSGVGALANIGFSHQGQRLDYGFKFTRATENFRQLGLNPDEPAPAQSILAGFGMQLLDNSSISLSYVNVDNRMQADTSFINANYHQSLFRGVDLSTFVSPDLERSDTLFGVVLTVAFGAQAQSSVNTVRQDNIYHHQLRTPRTLPPAQSYGHPLHPNGTRNRSDTRPLEVATNTGHGRYRAEAEYSGEEAAYQVNVAGSATLLNGDVFLSD